MKSLERPLTELKAGDSGVITSIKTHQGHGKRRQIRGWGMKQRLMDMGLTPGTIIKVVNSAPFHGPIEIYVRGFRLAIGRGVAYRIFVEVNEP